MIKKALVAVEYVRLTNTTSSILECQSFLNPRYKIKDLNQYLDIIQMRGGIMGDRTLYEFGNYIVKDQLNNFTPYTPGNFERTYSIIDWR